MVFEKAISYVRVIPGIVVDNPEQADMMFEYNVNKGVRRADVSQPRWSV